MLLKSQLLKVLIDSLSGAQIFSTTRTPYLLLLVVKDMEYNMLNRQHTIVADRSLVYMYCWLAMVMLHLLYCSAVLLLLHP